MKKYASKQEAVKKVMADHGLDFIGRDNKPIKSTTIHIFDVDMGPTPVKGPGKVIDVKKEAEKVGGKK